MKTKNITVVATSQTFRALENADLYSDSPAWLFQLLQWIESAERSDEIALSYYVEALNEQQLDKLIVDLDKIGLTFYRVITKTEHYGSGA